MYRNTNVSYLAGWTYGASVNRLESVDHFRPWKSNSPNELAEKPGAVHP